MFLSHHRTAIEKHFSNFSLVWLSLQIPQFFGLYGAFEFHPEKHIQKY